MRIHLFFKENFMKLKMTCFQDCQLKDGGAEGIRTHDPHNAIVVLYQLSYDPIQSGA